MGAYESRFAMYPYWIRDYLSDPRVMHHARKTISIGHWRRQALDRVSIEEVRQHRPMIVLSFDIERDVNTLSIPFECSETVTAKPFLNDFLQTMHGTEIVGTFFVQGELVERLAMPLGDLLTRGSSIGLHGFRHELWGKTNWISRHTPVTPQERQRRMQLSLECFDKAGLPRPKTFRAPNFTIDHHTYRLLRKYQFTFDSSLPTQRGNLFFPTTIEGVRVVPVSCSPIPTPRLHPKLKVITAAMYRQFNFDHYVRQPFQAFIKDVEDTMKFQVSQGIVPHILMYAHNWEFYTKGKENMDDIRELRDRTRYLIETYGMRAAHIEDLGQAFDYVVTV